VNMVSSPPGGQNEGGGLNGRSHSPARKFIDAQKELHMREKLYWMSTPPPSETPEWRTVVSADPEKPVRVSELMASSQSPLALLTGATAAAGSIFQVPPHPCLLFILRCHFTVQHRAQICYPYR